MRSSIKELQAPGKPGRNLTLADGLADKPPRIFCQQFLVDEDDRTAVTISHCEGLGGVRPALHEGYDDFRHLKRSNPFKLA